MRTNRSGWRAASQVLKEQDQMSRHGLGDARNRTMKSFLVKAGVVAMLAAGLAGCSALPDWAKPGEGATAAPTPEGTTGFPNLADTPDKKPDATSAADQKA